MINESIIKISKKLSKVLRHHHAMIGLTLDENGWADVHELLQKFGNIMGCSYCFPHGFETVNSTVSKNKKSWKLRRKTKWKI